MHRPGDGVLLEEEGLGARKLDLRFHRVDNLPPLTAPTARLLSYYGIGPLVEYPEVRA